MSKAVATTKPGNLSLEALVGPAVRHAAQATLFERLRRSQTEESK